MVGPPWRSCSPSPRRRPAMGEWDGLESRLKDLGDEAARLVDDPLDPARVRGLADRRRLRRSVAAVADRGRHPRLRRGRRVRGHVPTGAVTHRARSAIPPARRPRVRSRRRRSALAARGSRAPRPSPAAGSRCHRPTRRAARTPPIPPRSHRRRRRPPPRRRRRPPRSPSRSRRPPGRRIRMRTRPRNRPAGAVAAVGRRRPPRRRATRPPAADARLRPRAPSADVVVDRIGVEFR